MWYPPKYTNKRIVQASKYGTPAEHLYVNGRHVQLNGDGGGLECDSERTTTSRALLYDRPLAPEPTLELPGTVAKLMVMRERAELGFCIFHPHDACR